jgi:MinD superfamily P-loop ATPase
MKIAVLSGKGGTGKTTVSASLAVSLPGSQYIDCDVEEPNGSIFLKPEFKNKSPVKVAVPEIDIEKCDGCGECAKACQFNALAVVKGRVIVFPELCHHCGTCGIACPVDAITEVERTIGVIEANGDDTFIQGKLNIGEPVNIPVIQDLRKRMKEDMTVILDCSPGASCTVVNTIEGCDYCILVTEPTPFGLHDLKIAVSLVKKMGLPFGVILNKASENKKMVHEFCKNEGIELLMEIPFSREIAENYSNGILPAQNNGGWKDKFIRLYEKIQNIAEKAEGGAAG